MTIPLSVIQERALTRPMGYLENVLSVSTVVGSNIEISEANLKALRLIYQPDGPEANPLVPCECCKKVILPE